MKYKLIKVNVICQTIDICNSVEELENYWNKNSDIILPYREVGKIEDTTYFIKSGKIKDSDCIVTIIQYTLNYLP